VAKKNAKKSIEPEIRMLHGALLDLIGIMNQPQRDAFMVAEAGITLDSTLFSLLIGIERFGPIGVVELADRAGRDYTTVSRQVSKLRSRRLVTRRPSESDARVNEAMITDKGREMVAAINAARTRVVTAMLDDWTKQDVHRLALLLRRLADSALMWTR
jgi:DNA-binding MarR family transcriptional regulator